MFKSLIRTFAIVAAFIAGYMMPGLHVYSWTFKWMLVVMLFVTFLGIRFKRMKPERAHWLLTGANLMVALAAWGVCRLVFGDGYLAQAAFFVGIMPTATAAPVVMGLLGGSVEFMLTALLLINGIICALLPFILPAVVGRGGFEIYLNVAQNISLIVNTLNLITHTHGFSSAEPVPFIFSHKEKKDNRAKANPADFPE